MAPLKTPSYLFLFLLPVFFVLHGYVEFYDIVFGADILILLIKYIIAAFVLRIVLYVVFKNWQKAALYSFILLCFHFFFGSLHDSAKTLLGNSLLTKYSFILPFSFTLLAAIFLLIWRTTNNLNKWSVYLTIVLMVIIATDAAQLISKANWSNKRSNEQLPTIFTTGYFSSTPDIYFILADEYAGHEQLKSLLRFDNSAFENELSRRGFHIIKNSRSNYNSTPFSLASMLNMEYLENITGDDDQKDDLKLCYEKINRNHLTKFLKSAGYQVSSYSVFNFSNIPTTDPVQFFPHKDRIISSQTFLSRIQRDILYHLIIMFKIHINSTNSIYNEIQYNNNTIKHTMNEAVSTRKQPRFIYTHLMMPHYPYYYDKNGNLYSPQNLLSGLYNKENEYTNYLQYSNPRFLKLIDHILTESKTTPIIIFMSDHGFRFYDQKHSPEFQFMNINAVYLPNQQYQGFYDGMSNVNQFRVLLNSVFGQRLPLLKDSTIFIN